MDEEPNRQFAILDMPTQVTSLLRQSRARWVRRTASEVDAAASQLNEEQDIKCLQPGRFDREEVVTLSFPELLFRLM